jgi:hypothetical protein
MAIGTQKPKVLEAIVIVDAVDVIEVEHEAGAQPLGNTAQRAAIHPSLLEKPSDDRFALREVRVLDEYFVVLDSKFSRGSRKDLVCGEGRSPQPTRSEKVCRVEPGVLDPDLELVMCASIGVEAENRRDLPDRLGLAHQLL